MNTCTLCQNRYQAVPDFQIENLSKCRKQQLSFSKKKIKTLTYSNVCVKGKRKSRYECTYYTVLYSYQLHCSTFAYLEAIAKEFSIKKNIKIF